MGDAGCKRIYNFSQISLLHTGARWRSPGRRDWCGHFAVPRHREHLFVSVKSTHMQVTVVETIVRVQPLYHLQLRHSTRLDANIQATNHEWRLHAAAYVLKLRYAETLALQIAQGTVEKQHLLKQLTHWLILQYRIDIPARVQKNVGIPAHVKPPCRSTCCIALT